MDPGEIGSLKRLGLTYPNLLKCICNQSEPPQLPLLKRAHRLDGSLCPNDYK